MIAAAASPGSGLRPLGLVEDLDRHDGEAALRPGCGRKVDEPAAPTIRSGAVSPIARDSARIVPGQDPRRGRRQDERADHLPARRAEGVGPLALRVRDGPERLDGWR